MNALNPLISLLTPEEKLHNDIDTISSDLTLTTAQDDVRGSDESLNPKSYPDFMNAYRLTQNGLYFIDIDKHGHEKPLWLSSSFEIVATTSNSEGNNWGRLVKFSDQAGKPHSIVIPMEGLAADGLEIRKVLQHEGLSISGNRIARERLLNYLQSYKPDQHRLCVNNAGWHGITYVMTDRSFDMAGNDQAIYQNTHGISSNYSQSGALDDWITNVSRLAQGNSRLILTICMGLAGTLLKHTDSESGGIHIYGNSSDGKTTSLKLSSSVWGKPSQFMRTWLATGNGLEGIASLHNDGLLALDELGQSEPRTFTNSIYTLANGQGKVRANAFGQARQCSQWRVMILSTGEITTEAHINQAGQRIKAGQVNRLLNLEADAGAGMGLFEDIHGAANPSEFAKMVTDASEKYYGTVGLAWVEYLSKSISDCTTLALEQMHHFMRKDVPVDAQGQVLRAARRFALIAAAGEMATAQGFTGWQEGEAMCGVAKCFNNWLSNFGGEGNHEERAILSHVRSFIEAHGSSRFSPWYNEEERISNRIGFIKTDHEHGKLYLVQPEQFISVICKGFDPKRVERVLLQHGWLLPNERNGGARKHSIPLRKATVRMYTFVSKKLTNEQAVIEPEWLPRN